MSDSKKGGDYVVRLRLTGLPVDIQTALNLLSDSFTIISVSPYLRNRNSKFVRLYAAVEFKTKSNHCEPSIANAAHPI